MSKPVVATLPVVVWTPDSLEAFVPATGQWIKGHSWADIKAVVGSKVVVALGRRASFVRTTRLPDAPKPEVRRIVMLQIEQLFPTPASDTAVDFYLTDDRNSEGRLAVVAATRSETLRELTDQMKDAGISAEAIVPVSTASALLAESQEAPSAAIVEETAEGLAVDLIEGGALRSSRVAPSVSGSDELMAEIDRTCLAAKLQPAEIIASGGLMLANATLSTQNRAAEILVSRRPLLSLELPELQAQRTKREESRALMLMMVVWILALAVGLTSWLDYRDAQGKIDAVAKSWKSRIGQATDDLNKARGRVTKEKSVNDVISRGLNPKQYYSDDAMVVNSLVPKGVWLTGLTFDRGKLASIRATATNGNAVTAFTNALSNNDRFRDVVLVFRSDALIEETPVVNFSLSMHIVGNFPVAIDTKKK